MAYTIRDNVGLRRQRGTFDRFSALPDPGHKIRGGGVGGGGDGLQRIFFGPLGLTFVYKKEGGDPPTPPPPGSSSGSTTVRSYESAKISLVEVS